MDEREMKKRIEDLEFSLDLAQKKIETLREALRYVASRSHAALAEVQSHA